MFGRTALHNAVLGHHVEIVEWLLAAGADISIVDRSKDAPLHTAVRTGNENLVKVAYIFLFVVFYTKKTIGNK